MALLRSFIRKFSKKNKRPSGFAEAIAEGFKDAAREMGYRV